jgi:hypothetical protein
MRGIWSLGLEGADLSWEPEITGVNDDDITGIYISPLPH